MKSEDFIIPLNGLHAGKTDFSWHVGKEFFVGFDNSDIIDADLRVRLTVGKSDVISVDCLIDGKVTVLCDNCLEELELPIVAEPKFVVKFGDETEYDECESETCERETLCVPADKADLDMSQAIYDYSLLALPAHRVHVEGECNPETLKYLSSESELSEGKHLPAEDDKENENSPFAVLKDIYRN